jgi:hypothetical protein
MLDDLCIRRNKALFGFIPRYLHAARAPLQRLPDCQQATLAILPPLMIPKTEGPDALLRQNFFARPVALDVLRQAMLKTVKLNRQRCVAAAKVQNMFTN